jgi:hypothetical protein
VITVRGWSNDKIGDNLGAFFIAFGVHAWYMIRTRFQKYCDIRQHTRPAGAWEKLENLRSICSTICLRCHDYSMIPDCPLRYHR